MNPHAKLGLTAPHHAVFAGLALLALAVLHHPLATLLKSSLADDAHSSILLVVPVSALLVWRRRRHVFAHVRYSKASVLALLALLVALIWVAQPPDSLDQESWLSLSTLLCACWLIAAFAVCYGSHALRRAYFPLMLLLVAGPLPQSLRTRTIVFLQNGSADAASLLFQVARVPVNRVGVVLTLPRVTIEIARECSGLRSSVVLLITTLLIGHLFLKSWWSQAGLVILLVPITIAKNGLRIFVLSVLGMYVDPSFLTGRLHHHGGIVFFALAFACLWGIAELFQKIERRGRGPLPASAPEPAIAARNSS